MKDRKYILAGIALVTLYILPAIIAGDNHFVLIHDFLDSTVAHIKSMKDNGILFDSKGIIPILNGIPRGNYLTAIDLKVWLFMLLPSYWAVVANIFLIKITAFLGLFLLLERQLLPEGKFRDQSAFISAALFAMVPFYPDYGISSSGVPLVAYAFINLFEGRHKALSFGTMVYYALFSWLVLSGVFVCICAALVILFYIIRCKRFPWLPFLALALMTVVYIGANFQLFVNFFNPADVMHREEFKPLGSGLVAIGSSLGVLFVSQYHAGTCCAVVIVTAFAILWKRRRGDSPRWDHLCMAYISLASLMVVTAILKVLLQDFKLVQEFQFDRFFFLYPAMCYILLGAVIYTLLEDRRKKLLALLSAVVLVTGLAFDHFVTDEAGRIAGIKGHPGFRQFYDTDLFDEIKRELPIPDEETRVACLGMYQAVAEYNDIYTVDGYIQIYPLDYKHRFQKVIQGELDKDPVLWDYFCNWGTRCYLFSSELGRHYMFQKDCGVSVKNLDIDTEALASLGCNYILSAVDIENCKDLGLEYVKSFTHDDSYWDIRVYRLATAI